MRALFLQSGSNGNCAYVEAGGLGLLFDAGISGVRAERRLAEHGVEIRDAHALLISHEHGDHVRCAGVLHRKFGCALHITSPTLEAAGRRYDLGRIRPPERFDSGDRLRFRDVLVETIPTPHDGRDGVAFVVEHRGRRLGILTDLGHPFDGLADLIRSCDGVLLESNHDSEMLKNGPYPPRLEARISGPGGHLSNREAASLLASAGERLRWACLAHLSEENNTPATALATCREAVGRRLELHVAGRYGPSAVLELS
ncbi:MAG: MBL fold metallo-hydrolase [Polyangia bacterium]